MERHCLWIRLCFPQQKMRCANLNLSNKCGVIPKICCDALAVDC